MKNSNVSSPEEVLLNFICIYITFEGGNEEKQKYGLVYEWNFSREYCQDHLTLEKDTMEADTDCV